MSVRTLRRYDEQGLLVPALVDPDSHRRWYSPAQAADAEVIRLLRALDVPLEDVRRIVADGSGAAARDRLIRHREAVREQAARLGSVLVGLDALIDDLDPLTEPAFSLQPRPALRVVAQRVRCPLARLPQETGAAFGRLHRHLAGQGATAAGPPLALYHGATFDPQALDVDLAVPVAGWVRVDRDAGIDVHDLPPVRAVSTLHRGPYAGIDAAYRTLAPWAGGQGLTLAGEPREVYLVGPDRAAPPDLRTEIVWPVA